MYEKVTDSTTVKQWIKEQTDAGAWFVTYTDRDSTVVIAGTDSRAGTYDPAQEIARTASQQWDTKNVRHTAPARVYNGRNYRLINYTELSDAQKSEVNSFPYARELFPRGERVNVVSVYNYAGTYRWQHICHVLVVQGGQIKNVTRWVSDVIPNTYNTKHYGIQTDTNAYAQEVADTLGYSLYGEPLPYNKV
jgi:hypothetical protein